MDQKLDGGYLYRQSSAMLDGGLPWAVGDGNIETTQSTQIPEQRQQSPGIESQKICEYLVDDGTCAIKGISCSLKTYKGKWSSGVCAELDHDGGL